MLFHAVWDLRVTKSQMVQAPVGQSANTAAATAETGFVISPALFLVVAPSLLYAVFIFWRYLVAVRNRTITEPEFAGSLSRSTVQRRTDPEALVANDR